ncbi:MAG: DUF2442 domain-containing protein [Caulobacterales bacterium]|jgi:hypothetical protein
MIELVKVIRLKPLGSYRLWLEFSNGDVGARDFADMIAAGGAMVEPLRDQVFFARAFVQNGVPAWPNGLDIDAIALHSEMKVAGSLSREAVPAG